MYRDLQIGVVVPAYNEELLIRETLASNQDFFNAIYVVNDCLKTRPQQKVEEHAGQGSPVLFHQARDEQGGWGCGHRDDSRRQTDGSGVSAAPPRPDHRQQMRLCDGQPPDKLGLSKGDELLAVLQQLTINSVDQDRHWYLTAGGSPEWVYGHLAQSSRSDRSEDIYLGYGDYNDLLERLNILGFRVVNIPHPAQYRWEINGGEGIGRIREESCDECQEGSSWGDAIMVEIFEHIPEAEWKRFLDECSNATHYHTPKWKTFLEKTFDYKPLYLLATDECGSIIGALPLFNVGNRLTENRLCSVPFSPECGCLGYIVIYIPLTDEAIAIKMQCHTDLIEIRNSIGYGGFCGENAFCTHILDLSVDLEDTLKRLSKKVHLGIKRSEHPDVSVSTSTNIEDLKKFYELNCVTKQCLGVPCHPRTFLKNLYSAFDGKVHLYLSQYEKQVIAGGIMVSYKDHVLYGYSASDPGYLHLHPYHIFIWKSIEDAYVQGHRFYDFGRTSYVSLGLIQFKRHRGTRERELCYSYYPGSDRSCVNDWDSPLYWLENSVIWRIPVSAFKIFIKSVFSDFGWDNENCC